MALYVGTSGWAYREWKPAFYPGDLPERRFLEHYGAVFTACEINATFYRLEPADVVESWAAAVPEPFRFAVKAHRMITHRKSVAAGNAAPFVESFVASIEPLGSKLACVLLQFPPYVEQDSDGLDTLLSLLPTHLRFACEFRHPSWEGADVQEQIAEHGGTVCVADTEGPAPQELPPGPLGYVRLRSPHYDNEARSAWLDLLTEEARTRDVYAFGKHKGIAAGDPHAGIGLAEWLENSRRE